MDLSKKKRKSQQSQTVCSYGNHGTSQATSMRITCEGDGNPLLLQVISVWQHNALILHRKKISSLGKSCKSGKDKWLIVFYCNNPQNNRNINSNENSEQMNMGLFFSRSSFCNGSLTNHHHKDVLY